MKILFVSNSVWNIYNFRLPIIKLLIKKKYRIEVLTKQDNFYTQKLKKIGCHIHDIKLVKNRISFFNDLLFIFKLLKFYYKIKPDIVLHFTIKPVIYGSLSSLILNIKTINTITGLGTIFIKKNPFFKFVHYLYFVSQYKVDKVFFHNDDDLNLFTSLKLVSKNKAKVVNGSGVNIEYFATDTYPNFKTISFLYVGRIIKEKGIIELLNAFIDVNKKINNVKLILVGEVDDYNPSNVFPYLKKIIKKNENVKFYNFDDNIKKYLELSSCIVLPSYREGLPKSILEGMAMSRPAIVTNVPGCKDLVTDNYNGLLCLPKNKDSLKEALLRFINFEYSKKKIMGMNGRKLIESKYDNKLIANDYLEIIKSI